MINRSPHTPPPSNHRNWNYSRMNPSRSPSSPSSVARPIPWDITELDVGERIVGIIDVIDRQTIIEVGGRTNSTHDPFQLWKPSVSGFAFESRSPGKLTFLPYASTTRSNLIPLDQLPAAMRSIKERFDITHGVFMRIESRELQSCLDFERMSLSDRQCYLESLNIYIKDYFSVHHPLSSL